MARGTPHGGHITPAYQATLVSNGFVKDCQNFVPVIPDSGLSILDIPETKQCTSQVAPVIKETPSQQHSQDVQPQRDIDEVPQTHLKAWYKDNAGLHPSTALVTHQHVK